jgi:choline dehydrogenase-like flavoprotein
MLADFRQLDDGTQLEADLCIIGAGAAGITLARAFIDTGLKVILLESGATEFDPEIQALYEGESVGEPYELDVTRLRYFGGTTNHWEGVCGRLDDLDFEARPWVPHSGWPISRSDLDPFYEMARPVLRLAPLLDGQSAWDRIEASPLPVDPAKLRYGFRQEREEPVRFGTQYENDLKAAQNVRVFFHANAVNIQLEADGGRVQYVDLRTLQGKTGRVVARCYVLGCGAVENARLLLVSNSIESAGVGNRNDLVGRYFMEHPDFVAADVIADDYDAILEPRKRVDDINHVPYLKQTPAVLSEQGALNCLIKFRIVPKADSGAEAARSIYADLVKGRPIEGLGEKVWYVLTDLDEVVYNAYRVYVLGTNTRPAIEKVQMRVVTEQVPNPESRVTLTPEKDALQLNRVQLDWRLTEMEPYSVDVAAKTIGAEFGRLGLARVKLDDAAVDKDKPRNFRISYHQMGTTRMAEDPQNGVVDPSCRVHGIENLYVGGSSVFPTGGYMNPTFTIVALTLRLAGHLTQKLK